MRLFIALCVDPIITANLEVALRRQARTAPNARWVRPDSLHLSLAFLGEVAESLVPRIGEALERAATRHPQHRLRIRGSGTFGSFGAPKVLWAGVSGEVQVLETLQGDLVRELAPLGVAPDHEQFQPHITLARAKNPRGDPALARCADALRTEDHGELEVREVTLFESHTGRAGMRYQPLITHTLKASAPAHGRSP
jgi:RNA 2',3'-cyclic 3'-phosphodiesterase